MQLLAIDEVANVELRKRQLFYITQYSFSTFVLMATIIFLGGHIGSIYKHALIFDVKLNINLKIIFKIF